LPDRQDNGSNPPQPLNHLTQEDDKQMEPEQVVSQQAIGAAALQLDALPRLETAAQPSTAAISPKKRPARRIKPVSVDLDLLQSVAERFGVKVRSGKGHGYDQALLELLLRLELQAIGRGIEQGDREATDQTLQTLAHQAKTLAWLTRRVEQLEAQLQQQQEQSQGATRDNHDSLLTQLELLQAENHSLEEELQLTRSRLEGIQQFLSGSQTKAPAIGGSDSQNRMPQTQPATRADSQASHTPTKTRVTHEDQKTKDLTALDSDALRALHAIFDFNDHTATSHGDQWAISFPVMKDLLKQVGKASQPKIDAVLRTNSDVIRDHHQKHGLGDRHNRTHQGRSISEVIRM
jgi:hypothetical protein